jgi:hypothetical protein
MSLIGRVYKRHSYVHCSLLDQSIRLEKKNVELDETQNSRSNVLSCLRIARKLRERSLLVSEEAAEANRKFWLPILIIASKAIKKHLKGR